MPDQEQIMIEIDDSRANAATKRANAGLESVEKTADKAAAGMSRQWETVIRVSDRSKSSVDRLISSLEKQAATYGKTGVERLIAERDELIARYKTEQRAVDAITASYAKMIAVENAAANVHPHGNPRHLILGVKDYLEGYSRGTTIRAVDYLMSLRGGGAHGGFGSFGGFGRAAAAGAQVVESASEGIGATGALSGGAAIAVGGFAVALGAVEYAGYKSMESLAKYRRELENIHQQTGIAVSDIEAFRFAAAATGQDVSVWEHIMHGLAEAANDSSKSGARARVELKELGVSLYDTATGDLRPTKDVLLDLSRAIDKMPPGLKLTAASMEIFKRAGVEALPALRSLSREFEWAKEHRLALSNEQLERMKKYEDHINKAAYLWHMLGLQIKSTLADITEFTYTTAREGLLAGWMELYGLGPKPFTPLGTGPITGEYAEKVRLRGQADVAAAAYNREHQGDLAFRIRQLEQERSELPQGPFIKGQGDPAKVLKAIDLDRQIEHLRNQQKLLNEIDAFHKQIAESGTSSYLHILTGPNGQPISPLTGARAFTSSAPDIPGTISIAQQSTQLGKTLAKIDELVRAGASLSSILTPQVRDYLTGLSNQELQSSRKTLKESFQRGAQERAKAQEQEMKRSADTAAEYAEQRFANLKRLLAQVGEIDERNFARMSAAEGHQERMIALAARPGDELKTLHAQLALRERMRQEELKIKELHAALYDIDKERFQAEMANLQDRYDFEEKILEVKKQQTEEVESAVRPLVHTLFTQPRDFGNQFRSTVREAAMRPLEEGVTRLFTQAITPAIYGRDSESGLRGMFRSMFGGAGSGQDLLKGATDLNTQFTAANTAAIQANTAMMAQQHAFGTAQAANAGMASSGQIGYTPLVPGTMQRVRSASGLDTLQYVPHANFSTAIHFVTGRVTRLSGGMPPTPNISVPGNSGPSLENLLPLPVPPTFHPLISRLRSPSGFPILGQVASLGIAPGLFAPSRMAANPGAYGASSYASAGGTIALLPAPPMQTNTLVLPPAMPPAPDIDTTTAMPGTYIGSPAAMFNPVSRQPSLMQRILGGLFGGGSRGTNSGGLPQPPTYGGGSTGILGNLKQFGTGLQGLFGFGADRTAIDSAGDRWLKFGNSSETEVGSGFGGDAMAVASSPAVGMAGMMLAQNGLLGNNRGTWTGMFEGAAGGAMVGMSYGGPMGAAIGAGVGFTIGLGEKLAGVESPQHEAERLAKQIYGVTINSQTADSIVSIAQQKYGGHVSLAERAPEVRQMILLYSEATGQHMPLSAAQPYGASLVESGGKLYQQATYQDGQAYTWKSSLPTLGGYATQNYPSSVVLNVNGQSAADLLEGRIANTVTPSYVQDQFSQAADASYGRLSNSAMLQAPDPGAPAHAGDAAIALHAIRGVARICATAQPVPRRHAAGLAARPDFAAHVQVLAQIDLVRTDPALDVLSERGRPTATVHLL